ncbi:hypothetical protein [Sorangium sp. So ce1389]|uniref:hypothetical protein n=1 Tax=Sorangium sp. So ce1389 TaxID=3133336 RepID=UPI003F6033C4
MKELEGYDEMLQKLLDSLPVERRLAGLRPEERLVGLRPEERLVGLPPAHQLLALSDDALRGFTDEYLRSLPAEVQDAIRHG